MLMVGRVFLQNTDGSEAEKPEAGRVQDGWITAYTQEDTGQRLSSWHNYYSHLTDGETEAQSSHVSHTASQLSGSQPGIWPQSPCSYL